MKLALQIEGMFGLTWARWHRLVTEIERLGFAGLFRSDHFTLTEPPDLDALEAMVSLTYLAVHTQRMHFGTLVALFSFRDPITLARQAMALDDLSHGRMILGVGAGWMEREHTMFGYDLGDVATRMQRLEEGLEVITRLMRSEEPVSFSGRFYQLREAQLLPRPQRPTPIMLGGNGPKRTLPLVARYAGIWNSVGLSPALFAERSARLDELLRAAGRQPRDVRRTSLMVPVLCWRNAQELEARASSCAARTSGGRAADRRIGREHAHQQERHHRYTRAGDRAAAGVCGCGVEEVMIQWISLDDIEGIAVLAEEVLPHFAA